MVQLNFVPISLSPCSSSSSRRSIENHSGSSGNLSRVCLQSVRLNSVRSLLIRWTTSPIACRKFIINRRQWGFIESLLQSVRPNSLPNSLIRCTASPFACQKFIDKKRQWGFRRQWGFTESLLQSVRPNSVPSSLIRCTTSLFACQKFIDERK